MTMSHKRAHPASLSPVATRKSERIQPTSKDSRRATFTHGHVANRDAPDVISRVEKASTMDRARFRRQPSHLLEKLNDAIDLKQEELALWGEAALNESHSDLIGELEAAAKVLNERKESLTLTEERIDSPFKDQRFVTSIRHDGDGESQEVISVISERMNAFEDILNQEQAKLETLWEQWSEVQPDIICLAVEILGQANIDLSEHNLSDAFVKLVHIAGALNAETEKHYCEAAEVVDEFKNELVTLYQNTSKTMRAQQKTWRVERKRMLDSIKKAVADFEGLEV